MSSAKLGNNLLAIHLSSGNIFLQVSDQRGRKVHRIPDPQSNDVAIALVVAVADRALRNNLNVGDFAPFSATDIQRYSPQLGKAALETELSKIVKVFKNLGFMESSSTCNAIMFRLGNIRCLLWEWCMEAGTFHSASLSMLNHLSHCHSVETLGHPSLQAPIKEFYKELVVRRNTIRDRFNSLVRPGVTPEVFRELCNTWLRGKNQIQYRPVHFGAEQRTISQMWRDVYGASEIASTRKHHYLLSLMVDGFYGAFLGDNHLDSTGSVTALGCFALIPLSESGHRRILDGLDEADLCGSDLVYLTSATIPHQYFHVYDLTCLPTVYETYSHHLNSSEALFEFNKLKATVSKQLRTHAMKAWIQSNQFDELIHITSVAWTEKGKSVLEANRFVKGAVTSKDRQLYYKVQSKEALAESLGHA